MKLTLLSTSALTFLGLLVISSCGTSTKDDTKAKDFNQAQDSLTGRIREIIANLPSPHEIPYLLQATGAEFNQTLINDNKKADSYSTRSDKAALNLGVYAADIGYLSSYDKTQEAINHMQAAKSLADNLGIIGAIDKETMDKFDKYISNKDSLANLLDEIVKKASNYLLDDNRNKLAAMTVTGGFVEGLYISTGIIKSYPKDILPDDQRNLVLTPLMRVILEQQKSVDELVVLMSLLDQAEPVAGISADLRSLQKSFGDLKIEELIKQGKASTVLTDKNLEEITRIVEKLRKSIVD